MTSASIQNASGPWLARQLREVAGELDDATIPESLEMLAARIEKRLKQQRGVAEDLERASRQ